MYLVNPLFWKILLQCYHLQTIQNEYLHSTTSLEDSSVFSTVLIFATPTGFLRHQHFV